MNRSARWIVLGAAASLLAGCGGSTTSSSTTSITSTTSSSSASAGTTDPASTTPTTSSGRAGSSSSPTFDTASAKAVATASARGVDLTQLATLHVPKLCGMPEVELTDHVYLEGDSYGFVHYKQDPHSELGFMHGPQVLDSDKNGEPEVWAVYECKGPAGEETAVLVLDPHMQLHAGLRLAAALQVPSSDVVVATQRDNRFQAAVTTGNGVKQLSLWWDGQHIRGYTREDVPIQTPVPTTPLPQE